MGSLISEKQLTTVSHHVDDAVGKGATVLAGGRTRPDIGAKLEPTILSGVGRLSVRICIGAGRCWCG